MPAIAKGPPGFHLQGDGAPGRAAPVVRPMDEKTARIHGR